ncbi:hypothetical protein, partial [Rubrimonas cliftonensis]|uniref:hypothetical protein n=1 Tax=Rubrimonas cliftonensis TaxID=89524 RepID=UPI001C31ABC2
MAIVIDQGPIQRNMEESIGKAGRATRDGDAAMLRKGGWRRDSRRESSVIAGVDEQADTPDV